MMTTTQETFDFLINGQLRPAANGKTFTSINPSDGEVFAYIADAGFTDMTAAIISARRAFDQGPWPRLSVRQRGAYLKRIADVIRENAKELADLESMDTGKTLKQTTFIDVPTAADTFEYFSKIDDPLISRTNPVAAPVASMTWFEPLGVVGAIIPWNYPLIMFGWKVAPALITGNTMVFRPSSTASVSIMRLARLLADTGLPEGVLNIIACSDHHVAADLVRSPDVDMVSFTGGTKTGQDLMRQAAATTKKMSLELGGKSPNIVFSDCDMEAAVGGTLSAIFMNQGQMCTAGSRLLVEETIADDFLKQLISRTNKLKIGPALDYTTDFGPLVSQKQRDQVLAYIQQGTLEGARLVCGGKVPEDGALQKGFYLEPAIFTNVTPEMVIAREEIFGPVLCVMTFSTLDQAVGLANDTPYGLASCIWTRDRNKAEMVAKRLRCGTVWVNTYGGFYNEASFGGYKQSGFGRELGVEGLLEYMQSKHVCIDETPGGRPLVSAWF